MAKDRDVLSPEELRDVPRALIVVRKRLFSLTLWRRVQPTSKLYRRVFTCPIAIGAAGFSTPSGVFFVLAKAENPDWAVPDSAWAQPMRAQWRHNNYVVPGGHPDNPIRASFLKLTNGGIGIHGTTSLYSLRSRASHGCIRVRPYDARRLYAQVAVGSPVVIS